MVLCEKSKKLGNIEYDKKKVASFRAMTIQKYSKILMVID